MGRPTDEPKTTTKRARMSEVEVERLKECCRVLGVNESDVIRMGIEEIYKKIKEI